MTKPITSFAWLGCLKTFCLLLMITWTPNALGQGVSPVVVTGNIPFAKGLSDGNELAVWTLDQIRAHKDDTVNLTDPGATIEEKDSESIEAKLGYASPEKEQKNFTGTLDLTQSNCIGFISILVDDMATLTIKETGGGGFDEKYHLKGSALWKEESYKEFEVPLLPSKKYDLTLAYKNRTNLTNKYGGKKDIDGVSIYVALLPVEVAPEVLAVNSDFDEGRIDPATGYAIPDCDDVAGVDPDTGAGNAEIALNAKRDHLDGEFTNDEKITKDMHKGWFGVNPKQLDDAFWDGATVTIKKIDKIDDDTGYKESGQVRFYAKWGSDDYYGISPYDFTTLQPVNLVSAGVNKRPGEGVYGSTSTIPDNAEFWMEGVRPGKITLEWRYQKGSTDFRHEQTFQVETRQTLTEWREEVRYQIRLQTKVKTGSEVDVAAYHTGNGFRNTSGSQPIDSDNVARVQAIYYYYQQLFKQMPEKFMWAGMAKTAAAPIYAGMSDMSSWLWATDPIPPDDDRDPGVDIFVKLLLLGGQKAIYEDKAWAHRAYLASGKWALDWVDINSIGSKPTSFDAWSDLDVGIRDSDQDLINQANHDLLQREQRDVIQTYYASYATPYFMKQPPSGFSFFGRWIEIVGAVHLTPNANGLVNTGEWLSANANKNPMPGGPKFRDIVPGGRIDNYQHRWNWTANTANGMLSIWTGEATDANVPKFNAGQRLSESNKTMHSAAAAYSYDTGGLPIE